MRNPSDYRAICQRGRLLCLFDKGWALEFINRHLGGCRSEEVVRFSAHVQGARSALGFFGRLVHRGRTLSQRVLQWKHVSGVAESGMAMKMHSSTVETFRLLVTVHQPKPTVPLPAECMTQELLRPDADVSRNPRQPVWRGPDKRTYSTLKSSGSIEAPQFVPWTSSTQRDHFFMLTQARILREERAEEQSSCRKDKRKGGKCERADGGEE